MRRLWVVLVSLGMLGSLMATTVSGQELDPDPTGHCAGISTGLGATQEAICSAALQFLGSFDQTGFSVHFDFHGLDPSATTLAAHVTKPNGRTSRVDLVTVGGSTVHNGLLMANPQILNGDPMQLEVHLGNVDEYKSGASGTSVREALACFSIGFLDCYRAKDTNIGPHATAWAV